MRIAMFTDYFFPELGGIQDSIATISRALGQRGHHVDIYAPRYAARDYQLVGGTTQERDLGATIRVHRRPSLPFPSSTRQSRAALPFPLGAGGLAARRPDVIHVHSFFGMGLEAQRTAAMLDVPIIGTNHTTIAGFAGHIPVPIASASAYVRWFYNRCDYVTAPSRSVFAELSAAGMRPPVAIISNPIDTETFAPASDAARAAIRAGFGLHGPIITFAGRLAPEKNIDILLHAVAALHDRFITPTLVLAGHGSHESVLRARAAELRIVDQVKFIGTLAHPKLAQLLQISDAFAIMSTSETQSMVLLQAMASGIPVVAANSRALPEFVTPENGVLADPNDPQALAAIFANLLAAPALRQRLGAAGRQRAEHCSVQAVTDDWQRIYRSMPVRRQAA